MAKLSTYFENAIIDLMRNSAFTEIPAYVALFDENGSEGLLEAGTLTGEPVGNGYARELAGLIAPTDGVSNNAADIEFTANGGSWNTITYMALMDAISGGNVLMYDTLAAAKAVADGDTVKFTITTGLVVTLT